MSTTLDIRVKKANKVYREGVSERNFSVYIIFQKINTVTNYTEFNLNYCFKKLNLNEVKSLVISTFVSLCIDIPNNGGNQNKLHFLIAL